VAGVTAAWTSNNGIVNAGFGYLPAALFSALLAGRLTLQIAAWTGSHLVTKLTFVWSLIVVTALCAYQRYIFHDDPVAELDARMDNGPYRGLFTTPEKKAYVESIASDVATVSRPGGRILFYIHFSAGYLMTNMPPAASSVWAIPSYPEILEDSVAALRRDIGRYGNANLVIVRVHAVFYERGKTMTWRRGLIDEEIEAHYRRIIDRPDHTIFVP
jgi:hypothetical protein